MGLTPIPCIPPPRQYLPGLDGELIDVTSFNPGVRDYTNFYRAPKHNDFWFEMVNLAAVLAFLAIPITLLLWWLS